MTGNEVAYARVEEAMRAILADRPLIDSMAWNWYNEAGRRLGVSSESATAWVSPSWKKFQRQSLRALNKLAEEGLLRKYGRDVHTGFRSIAAQREIDRKHEMREAEAEAHWVRTQMIRERLNRLGLHPEGNLVLHPEDWDRLLDMAELGQSLKIADS